MTETAPLVPSEVDLRDFPWMPYFGGYLRDSDFNALADDAAWRAGHNLWWAAWHQVPAASLPTDERALARFADCGADLKAWRKVKAIALHGFVQCSDGRLYHRFLAKEALKAWANKQDAEVSREKERLRKQEWRDKKEAKTLSRDADVPRDMTRTNGGTIRGPDKDVPSMTGQDRTGQDNTSLRSVSGPRKRGNPKTAISSTWNVSDVGRAYAKSKGYDDVFVDKEAEAFRDHAITHDCRYADWEAAWRTWVQNAPKFAPKHSNLPAKVNGHGPVTKLFEGTARALAKAEQHDAEQAAYRGAGDEPAEPLLDGGRGREIARTADG